MLKFINIVIDSIFPPREDERLIRILSSKDMTSLYTPGTSKGVLYLSHYKNPIIQASIKENKYHHNTKAATLLASLLRQWILTRPETALLLIPIPLGRKRRRQRGHNQVMSIIKALPQGDTYTYNEHLIARQKETVTQTSLRKSQRHDNLKGAFVVNTLPTKESLETMTLVLIDDVVTTGATLKAAQATLLRHTPPSTTIISLALAH